jgi:ornithine cyclodeaminase/alanine dehydrogenase-like protein (mu-crystallin family)
MRNPNPPTIMSKNKYWYYDNWYGNKREFTRLKDAVKRAKKETSGNAITIFKSTGVSKIVTI